MYPSTGTAHTSTTSALTNPICHKRRLRSRPRRPARMPVPSLGSSTGTGLPSFGSSRVVTVMSRSTIEVAFVDHRYDGGREEVVERSSVADACPKVGARHLEPRDLDADAV